MDRWIDGRMGSTKRDCPLFIRYVGTAVIDGDCITPAVSLRRPTPPPSPGSSVTKEGNSIGS